VHADGEPLSARGGEGMKRVQLLVKAAGIAALLAGMAGCGLASSASARQATAEDMLPAKAASAQNMAAASGAFANFENAGDRVMCLDADSNHYPSNGDNVQLWACNTHSEQEWVLGSVASAIASTAYAQQNVQDDPANTYCNKYSAYWGDGSKCSNGLRADEWCADFAAWAWRQAGFSFTWGSATGDINASAKSFYYWAVAHNTWHTAGSGYKPQPGDVAVYGSSGPNASHVGVVYSSGSPGPNVVNGDWETKYPKQFPTAVVYQTNESSEAGGKLVGYASP
jgi:CHAP domain